MRRVMLSIGFVAVLLLMLCPMKASAEALPNLPQTTVTELHLVNEQAGNMAFNMNGVRLPEGASSILILNGIYKMMQAYNQWAGGEEYVIDRAYMLERQDMPAWLAEYSGDYIFWEISFFGDHITMITDTMGNITLTPSGNKALNVMVNQNMDDAVKLYKVQNNNSVQNLPIPSQTNFTTNSVMDLPRPYFSGKSLYFTIFIDGTAHLIQLEDFTNTVICVYADQRYMVHFPYFYVLDNSHDLVFIDHTTNQTLPTETHTGYISPSGAFVSGKTFKINGSDGVSHGRGKWYLPASYYYAGYGSWYCYWNASKINGYAYAGQGYDFLYMPNGSGFMSPSGLNYDAMMIRSENGQEVQGDTQRLPVVGTNISAESLEDIQDAISVIEPVTDPQTGIEIIEIPQNFPLPEIVPLQPDPPTIPEGITDFPQSDPEIVPPYDPSLTPEPIPTDEPLPDSAEQIQPMEELQVISGLQNRFPFSIPWDIYNAFRMLQAPKEPPEWSWTMNVNLWNGNTFTHTFTLSLAPVDELVSLFRDLFLLAFILGLAVFSYNKFFGGGA